MKIKSPCLNCDDHVCEKIKKPCEKLEALLPKENKGGMKFSNHRISITRVIDMDRFPSTVGMYVPDELPIEQRIALYQAIGKLTPSEKTAVMVKLNMDESWERMAVALNESPDKLRSAFRRACRKLKKLLGADFLER